jgi:hypothetical protein
VNVATPAIIDLYPCETGPDGVRMYRPLSQALAISVIDLAFKYPQETSSLLAATVWVTVTGYFIYQVLQPSKPRRRAK